MSNRVALRYNTGAADGSLFTQGYQNSFFKYIPWQVCSDKIRQTQRTSLFASELAFGKKIGIEVEKTGTLLEDLILDLTLAPIVGNGVGTYARVTDVGGLALLPRVEVLYQSNTIQSYDNNALFAQHLRDHDITHRNVFDAGIGYRLSAARRNTRAVNNQKFSVYLKPYWYGMASHCVILTALANKLKVVATTALPADFIETDYTNGASTSLVSAEFRQSIINTTGTERGDFAMQTFQKPGQTYLIQAPYTINYQKISAGTQKTTIDLKGVTLPFFAIYFWLQPAAYIDTPFQKKPFSFSFF